MLFRRTDKYGYSRYYGNGGPAFVIKIVVTVLLALVILLGGITFGLQRFMVYTENGGHLELPWKNKNPNPAVAADVSGGDESQTADASQGADGSQSDGASEESDAKEEKKPKQDLPAIELKGGLLVQHVSIGDVTGGYAEGALKDAGANGIMLFMKESGGALNYNSKLEMSADLNASVGSEKGGTIESTVKELHNSDYYTLAYLNAFDDNKLSKKDDLGLKNKKGKRWKNSDDVGWANPAKEEVRQYLLDLVSDMAELDYDEVVLYCACYPYGKGADKVKVSADREGVITGFYEDLAKVAREKDIVISVVADPDVILGKDSLSGQTLDNLKLLGGRVWVMRDEADDLDALNKALEEAGFPDNALGVVDTKLDKDSSYCYLNQD